MNYLVNPAVFERDVLLVIVHLSLEQGILILFSGSSRHMC